MSFSLILNRVCVHLKDNEEAPAELVPGGAGEENNSAGSCQLSAEMKSEDLLSLFSSEGLDLEASLISY